MTSSSSSSSRNWLYDVFPSFSGEDVRKTFLSHFLKELNRKLVIAFRDNEIERSRSLDPELKRAIRDSRIAVVVFSRNYASSSWCLNELLEIMKCKKELSQLVIPIFYHLDPSHVRKQAGEFGKIFEKTCRNKTQDEKLRWRRALNDVANILGYHTVTWDNDASMIETITNDLLSKLHSSPSNEFEDLVGIEDHIIRMKSLLNLESLMHSLLQEMGKEIVRSQSDEPGEREFLTDSKDICDVFEDNTGTKRILGIALDIDETDELHIHESAFKRMHNLFFLKLYTKKRDQKKEMRWHLPERFDHFPSKLRLLSWEKYPMRCMPCNFRPENLVRLQMLESNLEKLWEGVHPLTGLKNIDLSESENLKEIPNLSMATNLETLNLTSCSSLVELPSFIQYLNKLSELNMSYCKNLENLPAGINLKTLYRLDLRGCSLLRRFPDISTNISKLDIAHTTTEEIPSNLRLENLFDLRMHGVKSEELWGRVQPLTLLMTISMLSPCLTNLNLSGIPSLVELPWFIQNLYQLEFLSIICCVNLETLPSGINLKSLHYLDLSRCSRLKSFPDISRNVSQLFLSHTSVEEVPWWIEDFSNLSQLDMNGCNDLRRVSLTIFKLKRLERVEFSDCRALTEASFTDSPSDNLHSNLKVHDDNYISVVKLYFINSFNFDPKSLIQQQIRSMEVIMLGEEVPSYFTHRTTGTSLTNIPLPSHQPFFSFWCCTVVDIESIFIYTSFKIQVCCRFIERHENHFDSADNARYFSTTTLGGHLVIFNCYFPVTENTTHHLDGQLIYDHVDIQFRLIDVDPRVKLQGCGIQPIDPDNRVCERDQSNTVNLGSHETEQSQEYGDKRKRRKVMLHQL